MSNSIPRRRRDLGGSIRHMRLKMFGTLALFPLMLRFSPFFTLRLTKNDAATSLKVNEAPGYASSGSDRIKVFYNVYANPADDAAMHRAKDFVKEQMAVIIPDRHQVLIRSIGAKFKVNNATHIQHDNGGNEVVTLKLLWKYCQEKPSEKVVYLHNKGSFHPSKENDLLRKWLTRAALSEECASMPLSCNVCSWRMSPLPHPHTPGNMWAARCEYIRKLIEPVEFEWKMAQFYNESGDNPTIGTGRYAAEHWVHSHPSIEACDLSTSDYIWGYNDIPEVRDGFKLEAAPRYDWNVFSGGWDYMKFVDRWEEYKFLYNETPPASWFGWKFYEDSIPADFQHEDEEYWSVYFYCAFVIAGVILLVIAFIIIIDWDDRQRGVAVRR